MTAVSGRPPGRELFTLRPRIPYRPCADRDLPARWWLPAGLLVATLATTAWVLTVHAHQADLWRLIDLRVYRDASHTLAHAQSRLYTHDFGDPPLPFIYPPFAALVFSKLPFAFTTLKAVVTALSVLSLVAVAWTCWGMLGYRRGAGRAGAALVVAGIALWLEPVQHTLLYGQVNLLLMAAVVMDLALPDARWYKGAAVGVATGCKLTPGIFVVYLLLTRRFRAAAVAAGTFAATVVGSWLLIPTASHRYWLHAVLVGDRVGQDYLSNQSFNGLLRRLVHGSDLDQPLWLVAGLVAGVGGLVVAALLSLRGRELLALSVCGVTGLLVSPISWTHHWVWFVPLLVLLLHAWVRGPRRAPTVMAAAGCYLLLFAWPLRMGADGHWDPGLPLLPSGLVWLVPSADGREEHWNAAQAVVGNGYVIAGVMVLVLAAARLRRSTPGARRSTFVLRAPAPGARRPAPGAAGPDR